MGSTDNAVTNKLETHIKLLKTEFAKLQNEHSDLQRKYSQVIAESPKTDSIKEVSSFVSRLTLLVASIYGRSTYSDLTVRIGEETIPAHKFVFHARSEAWNEDILAYTSELDWSDIEHDVCIALLRWIYTDVVTLQDENVTLGLIRSAHRFKLLGLFNKCESELISTVSVKSCVRFYCIAEEVGALNLLDCCSSLISSQWDELTAKDFEYMAGPVLHKLLKNNTKHPLHAAIRLSREDAVKLYMAEKEVANVINSLSEHGRLPLQLALEANDAAIAELLVQSEEININAYDSTGLTILIDAIQKCNFFAAKYLLDHNCQLDLASQVTCDTALHAISQFSQSETDLETYNNLIDLTKAILTKKPNVNIQNLKGQTPLHVAIDNENFGIADLLLSYPGIDINIRTNSDESALELSLHKQEVHQNSKYFEIATRLINMGACTNAVKSVTHNSLLQELIANRLEKSAIYLVDYADINHINKRGFTALHDATFQNFPELVGKLLTKGANPNFQSSLSDLKSALHLAVEMNAPDVIAEFVNFSKDGVNLKSEKPNFNCLDVNGETPLCFAITLKRSTLLPLLITGGADVNLRNGKNLTMLHESILKSDSNTAIFLLHHGADMNALTSNQESPLHLAILHQMPQVVDVLCSQGVSLSAVDNMGDPPLWIALQNEFEDVAQVLVKHGVDIDCWGPGPDGCQQTLLHRAIDENKETAAIFLIRNQCDLDSPRQLGENGSGEDEIKNKDSPLHLCCQWGLIKVLRALIDHGANVNSFDSDNKTPLHTAIENQQEEIISIILCHPNVDLKIRDKNGNTPFATALLSRNHKAAQRILDRMPNAAEQIDQRGRNFLHLAVLKDDLESVLFLLAMQVNVNSLVHDAIQSSPLHLAAASSKEIITRNLILAGALVNVRDATQKTPLHIAAKQGNLTALSALMQNAADVDAVDNDGNNALHIAVRYGHLAIVRELLTESNINAEATNLKGRNPLHELCRIGEYNTAGNIFDLFVECMPKYPLNTPDMDGNTALLLSYMRGQVSLCEKLVQQGVCLGTENHEGANIFNYKLATDQLLYKLLDQLPQESPWSESDLCQECGSKFTLTMRKHHCRHCGRVLCFKCSNNDVPILKFGINKPVRVCQVCFNVIHGGSSIN
ncbi:rabankyrin-5 [Teleopsis dalmanni]|uniref:rabankyrin-5 n=1 Tax=Teleopsis dalmanni TaxID=139649 RepID=UPI0018CE35DE|nr:rabankyrin-5 [Teleopsis dalmanni]